MIHFIEAVPAADMILELDLGRDARPEQVTIPCRA